MANRRPRILIVDDADSTAAMFAIMLEQDYDCTPTMRSDDALMLYRAAITMKVPFDLILMDVNMPDRSGCDLAREIRDGGDTDTRMVFLTIHHDPDIVPVANALTVEAIWHKPLTTPELRSLLRGTFN